MTQIFITFLAVATAGLFLAAECKDTKIDLAGADPCSWGPDYWCQNITTSSKCGVTEWCQNQTTDKKSVKRRSLVGAEPCTWGPSYWCQNLTTSSQCGTTSWCINGTWKNMHAESNNSPVCTMCKNAMTEARSKLRNNATQKDIETFVQHEFNGFVLQNYSNFVEILASSIDASVVCSVVGLCRSTDIDDSVQQYNKTLHQNKSDDYPVSGNDPCTWGPDYWCQNLKTSSECNITSWCIDKEWKKMVAKSDNSTVCGTCKDAMTEARNKLNNNVTQKDMETFLQHKFNGFVLQNYSNFVELLASPIKAPVVCSIVDLCRSTDIDVSVQQHNRTLHENKSDYRGPVPGDNPCSSGPGYWCQNLKTSSECNITSWCIDKEWKNMLAGSDNSTVCEPCKDAMTEARNKLNNNATQKDMETFLQHKFNGFVLQNYSNFVELLASPIKAPVVCSIVDLCRSTDIDVSVQQHNRTLHENKSDYRGPVPGDNPCSSGPGYWCQNLKTSSECNITSWCIDKEWKNMLAGSDNSTVCEPCKDAMTEARNKLNNNATQKDMETFLQHKFNGFVLQNYSNFVELLASPIEAPVVCSIVGLCRSTDIDVPAQEHNKTSHKNKSDYRGPVPGDNPCSSGPGYWCQNLKTSSECNITSWCIDKEWKNMLAGSDNSTVCEPCKDAMTEARNKLNNNATQKDMETFLQHKFNGFVLQNYSNFVELLASPIEAPVVCSILGLCRSTDIDVPAQEHNKTSHKKKSVHRRSLRAAHPCNWGPDYWCKNLKTSSECRQTSWCINGPWMEMKDETDDSTMCRKYKIAVTGAQNDLENNPNPKSFEPFLQQGLDILGIENYSNFVDLLESPIEAPVICSIVGLCGYSGNPDDNRIHNRDLPIVE